MTKLEVKQRSDGMWIVQGTLTFNGKEYPVCEVTLEKPVNVEDVALKHVKRIYPELVKE